MWKPTLRCVVQARLRGKSLSRPILLALLLFGPSMLALTAAGTTSSSLTGGRAADHVPIDVPEWRIGDQWVYSTIFNAAGLVEEFGLQDSQMRTLYGDSVMWINDIDAVDIGGAETLVYERKYTASYDSGDNGARLQGVNAVSYTHLTLPTKA